MFKCIKCGYKGKTFIFQFTDYTYCVATNETKPEYITQPPDWVEDLVVNEVEGWKFSGYCRCLKAFGRGRL